MAFSWSRRSDQTDYKTQRWYGSNISIRTPNGLLNIQHDQKDNTLSFYSDGISTKPFKNISQLLHILKFKDHKIFLEWCQEDNGSYIYYDLHKIIQKLQKYDCISTKVLTLNANSFDQSCYFDESVSIESQLRRPDLLVYSPLRSVLARYTPMGIYEGHQLYLGPIPTYEFVTQFKIKYIFNCCQKKNVSQLTKDTNATERVFNVASWKWNDKYMFKPLTDTNEVKSDGGSEDSKCAEIEMNRMQYLDAMIDEIHLHLGSGNIVIHCLAGAHRSPFITGCYLYKYGLGDRKKTAEDIYMHLKGKREIVQELGYDRQIQLYKEYLNELKPHKKKD